jgi:hypothetical protein
MSRSEKMSPKSYIREHIYEKINTKSSKKKKISQENFKILNYDEYNKLLEYNYNVSQLKIIAKKYSQKVSGNKEQLINRIYNYLKFSHHTQIIQKIWRGKMQRIYNETRGPAFLNRNCVNETDFLSLSDLKDIEHFNFFSFKDSDDFIYGFDAKSFYNLIINKDYKNPYNRKPITNNIIDQFNKYMKYSKILKQPIKLIIKNDTANITIEQKISLNTQKIFQKIDEFGHITNVNWFLDLQRPQLIKLLTEFIDIWNYRASLTLHTKRDICPPHGNPFIGININSIIHTANLHTLRITILNIFSNVLFRCRDNNSASLGAFYILGSLTIVNNSASESMPWLFESFNHHSNNNN